MEKEIIVNLNTFSIKVIPKETPKNSFLQNDFCLRYDSLYVYSIFRYDWNLNSSEISRKCYNL